ncbi:MAG: glycosyltransferase [Cyanobacteriota bacterium]|nr:glycosyltransferase [Cyanobacteriota bacterium]
MALRLFSPPVLSPFPAPLRWGSALLITALGSRYLVWRLTSTLNLHSPLSTGLSVLLLAAELLLLSHGLLQVWLSCLGGSDGSEAIAAAAARLEVDRTRAPQRLPSVAVLVPSRGEPAAVIERCLRGCLAIDYPRHQVWLLDDSDREELRRLCSHLGCGYLARTENRHAKAGNLNHGLARVHADLIAVFDADVVPLSDFLRRTVGLFADPSVGFVQTPQTYMIADPLMRNLRLERWLLADEESFYRWIEPTRQRLGAVVCAGTSFVMRRQALLAVGGFETGTTSEDLATGLRLVAAGLRGVYVPEKLSAGLAPLTIGAMVTQRCRWASGTLQILRTGANPLTIAGLNPLQRLAYLEGIAHWLLVFPLLVLAVAPLTLGLEHLAPLRVRPEALLTVALPFQLSQLLLIRWLSGQSRSALMPELYRWVLAWPLARTVVGTLLGRPEPFRVTPKAPTVQLGAAPDPRLLAPLLALLAVQGVALARLITLLVDNGTGRLPFADGRGTLVVLGLGWALVNGLLILAACRACWDRPREDAVPWFAPALGGWLLTPAGEWPVEVGAISERGCEVRLWLDSDPEAGAPCGWADPEGVRLDHPLLHADPWPVQRVRVSRRGGRRPGRGRRGRRFEIRLGLHWGALPPAQWERLQTYLYRRPGLWPTLPAPWDPLALGVVGRRLLQQIQPESWFSRSLMPIR